MCSGGIQRGLNFVFSGGNPKALSAEPRPPRFRRPKTLDPEERSRRAEERARLERDRNRGNFGLGQTFATSPLGVSSPSRGSGGPPSLIGG
jgi:hypothetical protein